METLELERQKKAEGAVLMLELRRVIRASREKVYHAWTKQEVLQKWFAPGNMIVPVATLDVQEGGDYHIEMLGSIAACAGNEQDLDMSHRASVSGVYVKIVPNELLQFTWCGDWDRSERSLVTVLLRDVEGGTELTLRHEQFANANSRDRHQQGWTGSLAKLLRVAES